jgi:2-dehydropantoate 2-reductase
VKVVVFGAGAVGSWIGALLASKGHDVTLVGRAEHVAVVRVVGLQVSGKTEVRATNLKAVTRADEADVPDLLVLTVKAYDTDTAMRDAAPLVGERTLVLSLQNGLGNVERIAQRVDERRILAGVTTHGVTFVEPGHVRHAGVGYFRVGSITGDMAQAERVAALLGETGLQVEATAAIAGEIWAKVVVNAAINPATAVTGLNNGALLRIPPVRELMERAAEEAIDVARAEGAPLPDDDLLVRARRVAELTAFNRSSMLQDVERGRRTEIDAICGEIIQRGLKHGIDTPINLALHALVKGIEESTRRA